MSSIAPDDRARVPFERRFAPAPQARLVGQDLNEDPVAHAGMADECFDLGDLHGRVRIDVVARGVDSRSIRSNKRSTSRRVSSSRTKPTGPRTSVLGRCPA